MSKQIQVDICIEADKVIKFKVSKKAREYISEVIDRIQESRKVSLYEARFMLVNAIIYSGECQDHMQYYLIKKNTFKKTIVEITFWDLKMLKDLVEDFFE